MIDASMSNEINVFNARAEDALGYNVPGYQPHFHDVLQRQTRSTKTYDPLSVAAPTDTYFVVDNGDGSHSYTRSGNFQVSQGQLMTNDGRPVLGYPNGIEKGTLAPITVPEGVPDGSVSIASDGTVSYGGSNKAPSSAATPVTSGVPVTDAAASEHLAPPTASGHSTDTSEIALGEELRDEPVALTETATKVALPQDAGHIDAHAVLGKQRHGHAAPVQESASTGAPSSAGDAAEAASFTNNVKHVGSNGAGIGKPLGKIAMARFAAGTTIGIDGLSTSGPPLEMGPPGNGTIGLLKTGARDIGSVDGTASKVAVAHQNSVLNALLQVETARQGNAKKAMDLIK